MIRKPSTAKQLREQVIRASVRQQTVVVDGKALKMAGLAPESANLLDWLETLPRLEWHTWSGNVLTIHFEQR